ncbi:hypothetical protein PROFUN_10767 [Planoprotostelium fungivorum]|uniref:Uncharacterized protein n=1 Tax=Planoprotostelium fungivorum TaxID=1890364 RepID=A0A2P6N805_9EUKA|nr:hypothetical protein PROFUN_10767 [Planoprotostelium fungivorum]
MEHEFFERMGNTVDKLVQYVGELQSARKDNLNMTDDHTQQILPVLRQLEEEAIDTIRAINEEVHATEDFELLELVREVEVNIWNGVYENERYFYPESSYAQLPEGLTAAEYANVTPEASVDG